MSFAKIKFHFPLLDLPPELIGNVCEHLDGDTLLSIRYACKSTKSQSTTAFGQRYFQHLIAFLHPLSLTTLIEIARHSELSYFVKRVSISGERIGTIVSGLTIDIEDPPQHKDLQSSIEKSGLDALILKESFRALRNLKSVQIDTKSYLSGRCTGPPGTGIRCGRRHICRNDYFEEDIDNGFGGNEVSHVYQLMMPVIQEVDPRGDIDVDFQFWARTEDTMPSSFFDVQSPFSAKFLSSRAISIGITGQVDPQWIGSLLQTATDVRRLELCGNDSGWDSGWLIRCPRYSSSTVFWPKLSTLVLRTMSLDQEAFKLLLCLHQQTLNHIDLYGNTFLTGTWAEPISVLGSLKKLEYMELQILYELNPYPISSDAPRSYAEDHIVLEADSPEKIALAIQALEDHPCTKELAGGLCENGFTYSYQVDLSGAVAAVNGKIL